MTPGEDPAEDMEDMDPGLARERTELAWTRTAISFAALGGVILKTAPAVGIPILAMSALVWGLGRLARHRGTQARHDRPRPLLAIAATVTLVSVAALVVALLSHGNPLTLR